MTLKSYEYAMTKLEGQRVLNPDEHMFAQEDVLPNPTQSRDSNNDSVVYQGRYEIMGIRVALII